MKKGILIIALLFVFCGSAAAEGWDFYFFGVNTKMFKQADYKMVILGAATSFAVHTAGHYAYAGITGMNIRQDGLSEIVTGGDEAKYRQFAQAGFALQHTIGLILTSIPATRQLDFTKGYICHAFASTVTYPLIWGSGGDFNFSDRNGGNKWVEYAVFSAIATHNVLRVKWYKE